VRDCITDLYRGRREGSLCSDIIVYVVFIRLGRSINKLHVCVCVCVLDSDP